MEIRPGQIIFKVEYNPLETKVKLTKIIVVRKRKERGVIEFLSVRNTKATSPTDKYNVANFQVMRRSTTFVYTLFSHNHKIYVNN